MKNSLLVFWTVIFCTSIVHANTDPIESKLTDVTVYKEGATVIRIGKANLKIGTNHLEFVGLPSDLSSETIEVSSKEGLDILSIKSEIVYSYKDYDDPKHIAIQTLIQDLQDSISLVEKHAKVFQSEQALIQSNNSLTDSELFSVEELKKLASFHNTRIIEIENTLHNYRRSLREMNARLVRLKNESKRKTSDETGQTYSVFIDVESDIATSQDISIQYFIADAGWKPTYDVKLITIQDPLEIIYKADIHQNSDEEWKEVNITVSSASQSFGHNQPYIDPYFLDFNNWLSKPSKTNRQPLRNNLLKGRVTDSTGEPLIGANIAVKNTSNGTVTDFDGTFTLKLPSSNASIVVSYTGYESYESPVISGFMEVQLNEAALLMDEIVVVGMGQSNKSIREASSIRKAEMSNTLHGRAAGVATNSYSQGVNKFNPRIEYLIENKTSILSGEDPKSIKLQSVSKSAKLSYLSIPKYDEAAYLIAKIPDWHDLNLQSGDYNVIFEGKYLTSYYLNVDDIEEALEISLGLDENIRIKRSPIKEFSKKKFLSKDIQEDKAWKIEVTNGKSVPIGLELIDQYPISKNSSIKVDLKSHDNGTVNEETGEIKWNLTIPAAGTEARTLRYEVRHPKDEVLIVD